MKLDLFHSFAMMLPPKKKLFVNRGLSCYLFVISLS